MSAVPEACENATPAGLVPSGLARAGVAPSGLGSTVRWEERSTHRALEARRGQILERSRQIVHAAYLLLEEQGLEGLTIRAVLKRTALSRRAFYERFADKDDLMLAALRPLLTLIAEQLADGMQMGTVREGDPQRLAALVYNLVSTTVHTELLAHATTERDLARRLDLADDLWHFCRRGIAP